VTASAGFAAKYRHSIACAFAHSDIAAADPAVSRQA
jgi:hypothetical protein